MKGCAWGLKPGWGPHEQQVIPDRSRERTKMKLIKILLEYDMVLAVMVLVRIP